MNAIAPLARLGPVTYAEERFTALREEGRALFQLHWLEATADHSVPLDIWWQAFEQLEEAGAMLTVTARIGGHLVGYATYVMHPHLHYHGRLIAQSDAFFLLPAARRGHVGIKLFRVAEEKLRLRGVAEIWNREKDHVRPGRGRSTIAPVFRRLGFRPVEHVWRKRVG